jgi:UDP-glucose 4-epimerase
MHGQEGLEGATVAVTGATGDVGIAVLSALERSAEVKRVRALARSPFSPALFGFRKVRFQRGDVRSRREVKELVAGADVVVHLAFALHGPGRGGEETNVSGSRIVFEETARAGAARLCCASSIGGYGSGFRPAPLDEDEPFEGTPGHAYSLQKAAMERSMEEALSGSEVSAYALRLAIVAGPLAQLMLRQIPHLRLGAAFPGLRGSLGRLRPVLPDTGVPLQLVHEDDVGGAFAAAALGDGAPGTYNIAAEGTVTVGDLAGALGWRSLRVPRAAVDRAAVAARRLPAAPAWLEIARAPVLVETGRARRGLGWTPRYTAAETLQALVASYRRHGLCR